MNTLVLAVCIAMIVVQIRRLRDAMITSRVLMLLFWLTVLMWAITSWQWLAIPAIVLLVCGVFWDIGGVLVMLGLIALSRRFNTGNRFLIRHFLTRPRVARASPKRLVKYLNHKDYRMREAAAAEIANRGDPELVAQFIEIIENDSELRCAALDAIGMVGDISAADTIIGYLESSDDRVRLHAFGSLTRLRAPETLPTVVDFLTNCRKDNRNPAAYRFISDHGGAAAIGWVWESAPKHVSLLQNSQFSTIFENRTISLGGYKTLPYSGLNDIVGAGFIPALVSSMNFARGSRETKPCRLAQRKNQEGR